jgi:hypothetical protein
VFRLDPSLFTVSATGMGLAAAVVLRVKADGSQSYESIAQFDAAQNKHVPVPIDFGPSLGTDSDQIFLVLFGISELGAMDSKRLGLPSRGSWSVLRLLRVLRLPRILDCSRQAFLCQLE